MACVLVVFDNDDVVLSVLNSIGIACTAPLISHATSQDPIVLVKCGLALGLRMPLAVRMFVVQCEHAQFHMCGTCQELMPITTTRA